MEEEILLMIEDLDEFLTKVRLIRESSIREKLLEKRLQQQEQIVIKLTKEKSIPNVFSLSHDCVK